jgi:hypothetical protein
MVLVDVALVMDPDEGLTGLSWHYVVSTIPETSMSLHIRRAPVGSVSCHSGDKYSSILMS